MFEPSPPPPLTLALFAFVPSFSGRDDYAQACARADLVVSLGGCDLEELAAILPPGKPALCVLGPRDPREAPPPFRVLHGNGFNFRGWRVAGLSGAPLVGRQATGNFISELDAAALLEPLPACDIFLTHAAPGGIDELAPAGGYARHGLVSIFEYVRNKAPIYHFWASPESEAAHEFDETITIGVCGELLTPPLQYF